MDKVKVLIEQNFVRDVIHLFLATSDGENRYIGQPIVFSKDPEDGRYCPPTAVMSSDDFQIFVNQLWDMGFRPTNQGSKDAFTAQGKHLEDFRKIAFRLLKMDEGVK